MAFIHRGLTVRQDVLMMKKDKKSHCELCNREVPLTFHHLIPKKMHRRTFFRKNYDKETLNQGIMICRLCHNAVHTLFDEMTLAKQFSSLEALKNHDQMQKHIAWAAKQKA